MVLNKETCNGNHICENDVVIQIKGLKVWTPEEKSWWRRKPTKPKTTILNNVSGCIKRGEFAAVIGPSGAGKTTFLVSLAGKCTLQSKGTVMVNGTNVREVHGAVEIVPQFDVFMDSLNVMEHLVFMTEMKVGSFKTESHKRTLDTLISVLKLKSHVTTTISSLSGGEKRLLSLATSLLSNPQILICDEPTTGLDSYNASLVIGVLKNLTSSGKVVICSVHQPSCDLFNEFTTIMLMADGRLLFHGSQEDCKSLFESINLHCPMNYNPAEFYIRAVSTNFRENHVERILESQNDGCHSCDETGSELRHFPQGHIKFSQRNWFIQVHLLLWRISLTLKRDIRNHILQLLLSVVISSMVLGTCFLGITGTTQSGVQDLRGFLWLITSEVLFALSYNALYVFDFDIILFRREVGMYSCSAFFVSRFLSLIPRCVVWPITLVMVATFAVDLPNHFITTLKFMATLIFGAVAAMAYGLGMGAVFTSTGMMSDVMPCADLPLFLMSGAFLRISSMPVWLYPLKFISHFYYAMDAISNIFWRQIDFIECPTNSTSICYKDSASVLLENGYSRDFVLQDTFGLLFVIILWCVIGFFGLKREEKKGYAY